nr:unnamed protein product [Callosobruchus analis]
MCSKLSDTNINPNKVNKMKVKIIVCTQVFGHSVGSLMKRITQWGIKDNSKLPSEAADTADLLLFMDKLFDSRITYIKKFEIYYKRKLLQEKNFKFILTCAFNQDPLENFFSYIRSHGVRNTNPDISHFVSSFKSFVLNLLSCMSTHSPGSNCQKDTTVKNVDTLHNFLTTNIVHHPSQTIPSDTPQAPR